MFTKLMGLVATLAGIYLLGKNIYFTTNIYPYWWRGVAADFSILSLTTGIFLIFLAPKGAKSLGLGAILFGILLVFFSSRAILNPTSLWQFLLSLSCLVGGTQLLVKGSLSL